MPCSERPIRGLNRSNPSMGRSPHRQILCLLRKRGYCRSVSKRTLSTLYSYFTYFIAIPPHPHRGGGWHRIISRKACLALRTIRFASLRATVLLFFFSLFIACDKRQEKESSVQKKPLTCDEKLENFKTCLLSQFYSVSCPTLNEKKSLALKELCKRISLNSALEKECPQKIKEFQKTISEQKFNKCKKKTEVKQQ